MRPVHQMAGKQLSVQLCGVHKKGNMSLGVSGANAGGGEAGSEWNETRILLPVSLVLFVDRVLGDALQIRKS